MSGPLLSSVAVRRITVHPAEGPMVMAIPAVVPYSSGSARDSNGGPLVVIPSNLDGRHAT
jgi:hypothetical protein